jgi:hypothetical protein
VVLASLAVARADEPTYVGVETCVACHDEQEASIENSHHSSPEFAKRSPHGCETCHGPGSAHADDPDNVKFLLDFVGKRSLATEKADVCVSCHGDIGEKVLKGPAVHAPVNGQPGCVSCHSPHASDNAPASRRTALGRLIRLSSPALSHNSLVHQVESHDSPRDRHVIV